MEFTNKLAQETSPYLLQHAHNPVNWYPWGEEALQKALDEDKPILVSIGYAACHWCHVMERESFEDEATAALMNEHFINIKIDREERPDLDHIYMDAVQAMTGAGGWPLNVFLTPDRKPFYGGTYFPPRRVINRPSWKEVLTGVSQAYRDKPTEIRNQAHELTSHLERSNAFGITPAAGDALPGEAAIRAAYEALMTQADREEGGFGQAPKFPQTFSIRFLLQYHYYTGEEQALQHACLSLDKMIGGGLYDHIGGGFARYATDNEWLVPHFEKMLYDNALLVIALCDAWQVTRNPLYEKVIRHTLDFIHREMRSPQGGWYAALDADSEGEEGRYYVWQKEEIDRLLGEDAFFFGEYYDVTEQGNWEGKNILHTNQPLEMLAAKYELTPADAEAKLARCRAVLLQAREKRVRPALDDKILLGWNALMGTAYARAYAALGISEYKTIAVEAKHFLFQAFRGAQGDFLHTYKEGKAKNPAFLDDYAYFINFLICLQEITGQPDYLLEAKALLVHTIDHFTEEDTGYFYFTPYGQQDVIVRKKEVYDGATPSGNAVMASNLYYLGVAMDEADWRERATRLCAMTGQVALKYPGSFGCWISLLQGLQKGIPEIAIIGEDVSVLHTQFLNMFIPLRIFQLSDKENAVFPLLCNKPLTKAGKIYLCKAYACQVPVNEVDELMIQLQSL